MLHLPYQLCRASSGETYVDAKSSLESLDQSPFDLDVFESSQVLDFMSRRPMIFQAMTSIIDHPRELTPQIGSRSEALGNVRAVLPRPAGVILVLLRVLVKQIQPMIICEGL